LALAVGEVEALDGGDTRLAAGASNLVDDLGRAHASLE
jgi:hypothetical protein